MKTVIFCNTKDKIEIMETLLAFDEDKDKNKSFNEKKYQYANTLVLYRKSDLETARADIEHSIDSPRTLAAILAVLGVILSKYISLLAMDDLNHYNEKFKHFVELGITVLNLAPSAFIFLGVAKKIAWLHIIKIAIALDSELSSANTATTLLK